MPKYLINIIAYIFLLFLDISSAKFCDFPGDVLSGVSSVTCGWLLNDPVLIKNGLFSNVPYNSNWSHRSIDTLTNALENYGFVDYVRNSGRPFPVSVNIIPELKSIRNKTYRSDFEFQITVTNIMTKLHDGHVQWPKPDCYEANIVLPIEIFTSLSKLTNRTVYLMKLNRNDVGFIRINFYKPILPDLTNSILQNLNSEIVSINDIPTDIFLTELSKESSRTNDLGGGKNDALNFFHERQTIAKNPPSTNSVKLTLTTPNGQTVVLEIPYMMIKNSLDGPFNISSCLPPPPSNSQSISNQNIENIEKSSTEQSWSEEYVMHRKRFPHLQKFEETRIQKEKKILSDTNSQVTIISNPSDPNLDIPCHSIKDTSNRTFLILELHTFTPKTTCQHFRNDLKTCLSKTFDYVIVNIIGNGGGQVTLAYMTIQLLVQSAFKDPTTLYNVYDFKHSNRMDEIVQEFSKQNKIFGPLDIVINPKTGEKFDNLTQIYGTGRKVLHGGVISLRSNEFYLPVGPISGCSWTDTDWTPPKFYDSNHLFILTDGFSCGSSCATFSKTIHERNSATFVAMGGNWGEAMDISSFAGGAVVGVDFFSPPKEFTFMTFSSPPWNVNWLTVYSKINKVQPQQYHLNADKQIRLPDWDSSSTNFDNLYAKIIALSPSPSAVPSPNPSPSSSPIITTNCNNNANYSDTQVILIGVLPVCLLFLLVVVPLLIYVCMVTNQRQDTEAIENKNSATVKYDTVYQNNTDSSKIDAPDPNSDTTLKDEGVPNESNVV